jgi:hypothetical protein
VYYVPVVNPYALVHVLQVSTEHINGASQPSFPSALALISNVSAVHVFVVSRDGRRRLMVPNNSFISREFLVYDDVLTTDAARMASSSSAAGSRSSSPWPGSSSSSSATQQDAQSPYSTTYGASSGHVEPNIREGHMTTELPPLAPPIFPGMTLVTPGYAQYGAAHYAPYAAYQQLQQLQQQQQDEEDEDSADADEESEGGQQQQQQQQGDSVQNTHQTPQQQDGPQQGVVAAQLPADQQPHGSSSSKGSSGSGKRSRSKAAKGPPGYLPQGFTAPPPYLGIPVYWPLLNPWGTAPGRQQQQQQQQQQQAQQPQQVQQAEQAYFEFDGPGMHQPVIPHYSPLQQQQHEIGGHHSQDLWQQQQQQWPPQQWPQVPQPRSRGSGAGSAAAGSSSSSQRSRAVGQGNGSVGAAAAKPAHHAQAHAQQAPSGSSSSSSRDGVHKKRAAGVRDQAIHMAALGGSSYGFWGSPLPPVPLQPSDFQHQQYWQAMQQYPHHLPGASHASMQMQMEMEMHLPAHAYSYMQPDCFNSQQAGGSSSSSEGGIAASPADFLTAPGSPDPAAAAAAAAGSGLAANLSSLQPLSSGVGAASAAAAAAGAAMRHLPAQQLGGLAEQAAGGLLGPLAGMCKEVGQSLGELP